eukprot:PLAT12286.1.p1 GENE.PLAT12286.1~~PLAT12286.1.p1  ORF type:complete len:286 (-),score=82.83 PLAT12286.1:94-921(-)
MATDTAPLLGSAASSSDGASASSAPVCDGRKSDNSLWALLCSCCCRPKIVIYEDFATADEMSIVRRLRSDAAVPPRAAEREVQAALLSLWLAAGFPEEEFVLQDERWTWLGFQRDKPMSDVRGAGLMGLKQLAALAKRHPELIEDVATSRRSYPFCASALNITVILREHLLLSEQAGMCPCCAFELKAAPSESRDELVSFLRLFARDADTLDVLYVNAVRLMEKHWRPIDEQYGETAVLQFKQVLQAVRKDVIHILRRDPDTLADLQDWAAAQLR